MAVGVAVDRLGDRKVLLAGAVLVIVADGGVIMAQAMGVLLAWRLVGGLGYVCMVVGAVTMITRRTAGRQRTIALSLWSTVIPASFLVAGLYGRLAGAATPWRQVFLGHGAVVLGLALAALWRLPSAAVRAPGAPARLAGLVQVLRTPLPFVLGGSFAAAAFLQTGFVATLPVLLSARLGVSEAQVHGLAVPAMLGNIAGAFAFGMLAGRRVAAHVLGLGAVALCALCGLGLVLAGHSWGLALALDIGLMLGLGLLVGTWSLLPLVARSPATFGVTSGLITQITLVGVLLGPPGAFVALAIGPAAQVGFIALGCAFACMAWPVWRRAAERPAPRMAAHHPA
jgi:predicted MFS family arabinose efflux permease